VTDDENYEMYTGKVHIIQLIKWTE
jgi:hypothetical protein